MNIIVKVFAYLIFIRIPFKYLSLFAPCFISEFSLFSWLTLQTKILAFSVTLKLYDPVIITIMMASDHTLYINDKTYLATCLHSLLISLMRAVRLLPCKLYLKVIKN